jgi:hypothetical protein
MATSFNMGSESQQVSSTQRTDWGQPLDGGDQPASPLAVSLVVGLIVASTTGILPGGLSFSGGFFLGLVISLLMIYGSALIVGYRLKARQEHDRATEEARTQRELEIENRREQQQQLMRPPDETPTPTPTPTPPVEKSPPYNLYLAIACVGLGAATYVLTMLIFRGLIEAPEDVAIVSGALGVLFTLIGTVAGAYFGIKSTQDTTDKAAKQVEEAHKRESAALGALDSNKWANLRKDRLL